MDQNITIFYYVKNKRFASRSRYQVPRIGDEIRLNGICYKVDLVVWIEDQKPDYNNHVAISLQEIKRKKK